MVYKTLPSLYNTFMKKATGKSSEYWHTKAKHFSDLYQTASLTQLPSRIVAGFLERRSEILITLLPTPPIKRLLDLGCGSGPHMKLLQSSCKEMIGVDYSLQMLEMAKKNLKNEQKRNWKLIRSDAAHLPLPSHTFDCIIAMGLLDYVPSPQAVLKECRRMITPSGILIVSMPKKPSLFSLLRNPLGDFIKRVVFHLPPIDNALTKTELIALCSACGFTLTDITAVWGAMWMVRAKPKNT